MAVYSFIISRSFRLPLCPADGHDPPVMQAGEGGDGDERNRGGREA